ncbi:rhodanese-like domain-containing protein [Candidatus Woesearchaeota archaeon]|nr:rhodanese-like domain-containing protein [Candidatus Woesearchaeota archaeon]
MRYALMLLFLLGCASAVNDVTPLEAQALAADPSVFVLNVHTPYEGEIAGTDAFIEDWEHIANHRDQLPADKDAPILVYCRSGRMSTSAVQQLQELGYTNINHLTGGMNAWKDAGLPIEEHP